MKSWKIQEYQQTLLTKKSRYLQAKENIALLKPATSSSVWDVSYVPGCRYDGSKAVDGQFGVEMDLCQCFATADGAGGPNWLCVDMLNINQVRAAAEGPLTIYIIDLLGIRKQTLKINSIYTWF
ncbi:hypothetical protein HELRODRAFT_172938 [Helobdella robusta]|uniref:Fucolectin tachylectin-4 pentraxin-1 domain-containing protein n=1 Tax=Helobdella robusta TaxID=6412 RepID=T1F661_HELRO|nr:hypothetical protein HELRODRAFT_172938 [Helobdella robusta]ESO03910.1 hypothetical protein HELRODRAFT_172938 [Helobdella robusta]